MNSQELVARISKLLTEHFVVENSRVRITQLGNQIHVFVDDTEFVAVFKTTKPEKRWPA